ncbi:atp-binding cassette sub-family b [Holotrichia oblita]|nr:atp-binding cassette sub-family b [Holotrichia oblita]
MTITQNLLTPSKYGRPQTKTGKITKIAVHYVGNAGSSALANRNYFESLKVGVKNSSGDFIYASSHYIIGLQGEIIQCVPEDEIAYCTNQANSYSISIENCHPAPDGKFNDKTNASLIELCADICIRYELDPINDMIRHFDVNGKKCPLYHVNNPEEWDKLKKSVKEKIKEIKEIKECDEVRYESIDQIPAYAIETIKKLINNGLLAGTADGKLNLSEDMIRLLVINDRAGLYEKNGLLPLFGLYLPKLAVELVLENQGLTHVMLTLGGFAAVYVLLQCINNVASQGKYPFQNSLRFMYMRAIFEKALDCDYNIMESSEGQTCFLAQSMVNRLLSVVRDIIAYAYCISEVINGGITVPEFVLYMGAIASFSGWMNDIITKIKRLKRRSIDFNDLRSFFEYTNKMDPKQPLPISKIAHPIEIEFKNVGFQILNDTPKILDGLSFHIRTNEKIALVGVNGAGKTTIVKLLCGFYKVNEGEILINGYNIDLFKRADLYTLFSAVFQDICILPVTAGENISFINADKSGEERLLRCLEIAGIKDEIMKHDKKLNAPMLKVLDEDGIMLSGGQQQKLLLARALYKDAPILILDEPTAALDPIAESEVYEKFYEVTKNKMAIYISHRLASTRFCDKILMLKDGRIIESGNHNELIAKNGERGSCMKNDDLKSSGLKGALKVYKILYETDKLLVTLQFPAAILSAVKPYISLLATAYILDGFVTGQNYEHLFYIALSAVLLEFGVDFIEKYISKIQQVRNDVYVPKIYMAKAEKYLTMDYQLLESPAINKINARISRDNRWGSGFYNTSFYLRNLLDNFFGFIVGAAMIIPFFINNNIGGGVLFVALLFVFGLCASLINSKLIQAKLTSHLNSKNPEYDTKYNAYFIYGISISSILKPARIYNIKKMLSRYLDEDDRRQNAFNKVFTKYKSASGMLGALTSGMLTVSAYLFIVAKAVTGAVSISNVVRYAGTIYNAANSFFGLSSAISRIIDQTDRIQGMLEFMEIENVLYKGSLPVEKRRDNDYMIEFHNVSFKYPGSENYSLRNFSIKLNIGHKLAIVGMNGSGKTTMIKLLCRLYDPSEGSITLNGIDIKKYDYAEYMGIFSVVFQDFKIFSFKLSENIACSTEVNSELAANVLNMVGLSERTEKMKNGLDTYLYNDFDKGVEISGGEAQKIALARALYKNAPFIVLDEPTAALDPIAEFEIYSKFNEIAGDKTTIYISHRLSSCRFCDDIAVFHKGELIQRGSHDMLLADRSGKYYELWNAQAQYYTENVS